MTSSSGMLGVNEVESLASQLASQVSYSNELLMQVGAVESLSIYVCNWKGMSMLSCANVYGMRCCSCNSLNIRSYKRRRMCGRSRWRCVKRWLCATRYAKTKWS